jgi:hypothetical protein
VAEDDGILAALAGCGGDGAAAAQDFFIEGVEIWDRGFDNLFDIGHSVLSSGGLVGFVQGLSELCLRLGVVGQELERPE